MHPSCIQRYIVLYLLGTCWRCPLHFCFGFLLFCGVSGVTALFHAGLRRDTIKIHGVTGVTPGQAHHASNKALHAPSSRRGCWKHNERSSNGPPIFHARRRETHGQDRRLWLGHLPALKTIPLCLVHLVFRFNGSHVTGVTNLGVRPAVIQSRSLRG